MPGWLYIPSLALPMYSLDLDRGQQEYLSRTDANFGYNKSKGAISLWFKRKNTTSSDFTLFAKWAGTGDANNEFRVRIMSDHRLEVETNHVVQVVPGSPPVNIYGQNVVRFATQFNDTDWHHVLIHLETTKSTNADRIKAWADGSAESINSSSYIGVGKAIHSASSIDMKVGAMNPNYYWHGFIWQWAWFDNTLPAIGDVYDTGGNAPKDVKQVSGIFSLLDVAGGDVTNDAYLAINWTDNNTVDNSTDTPA